MRSNLIIIAVMMAARSAVAIELLELKGKIDPKKCTIGQVRKIAKMESEEHRKHNYTKTGDELIRSGENTAVNPFLKSIVECHSRTIDILTIRSHPSEETHASKCNGSMVIIGVCVGLEDITYLGMGCHATADSDRKDLATNKEWNRICGDGDSVGKNADSGHSSKNSNSKLVSAVIGAIAAVVGFLSGFFCYKKFFTAKPDQAEFVTPVPADQANKDGKAATGETSKNPA